VGSLEAHIIAPRENASKQLMREAVQTRLIIDVIGVERPSWRHGVGTELMLAAEQWGRQKGAELAVVDTYVDSPVSVPFYERLGYQPGQLSYRKLIPSNGGGLDAVRYRRLTNIEGRVRGLIQF
jgi:GNAT superfamily N-acetyltransferase